MSSLACFDFLPDYTKGQNDIANEFYIPCMKNAIKYDRISGYFSSAIFLIAWTALKEFVNKGARMRLVCSPHLSKSDLAAIEDGYDAKNDERLEQSLIDEIKKLMEKDYLYKPARVLASLIAMNVIEIKLAFIEDQLSPEYGRLFHDKLGIFYDLEGNAVGFRGSMNETYLGLASDGNLESIDVFPSWSDKRDLHRVNSGIKYFENLWANELEGVIVKELPKLVQEELEKYTVLEKWEEYTEDICREIELAHGWSADKKIGGRLPRDHQIKALENWKAKGRRGIFEHATGSGKTFTALCAIRDALSRNEVIIILVPSKLLLEQWYKEVKDTLDDLSPRILLCGDGNNLWRKNYLLHDWTRKGSKPRIVISTMNTASENDFIDYLSQGEHLFIVADEVHRLGSNKNRRILSIESGPRMGLSATPNRAGDEYGTELILRYFEGVVLPPFTLKDAINSEVLTPYMYYPKKIFLSEREQELWDESTKKISTLYARLKSEKVEEPLEEPSLKNLLIKRARIIKNAQEKIHLCVEIIKTNYCAGQKWIIYCDGLIQLQKILSRLRILGYDCMEYHSNMKGNKEETIKHFVVNGGILVSIKCLDEGVDIPAVSHALILASSKNPREYIQRRGRILRKYPGKYLSFLYDAIVVPHRKLSTSEGTVSTSILEAELSRAIQFGEWASNAGATYYLKALAIDYGIDYEKLYKGGYEDDEE